MRVLLVEDDPSVRRILGRLLTSTFGVELSEAENGVDGLAQIEAERPDLLVMDVDMPLLDGFGMLSAIRASPAHRTLPAVAVSSLSERSEVARLIQLEISDYLLKPLDMAAATRRLGRVIQQIRAAPRARPAMTPSGDQPSLLLVDPDPNFRQLFKTLLEGSYLVSDTASGAQAMKMAVQAPPTMVCLAEGLGLLSETQLATHLRALATPPRAIYLLHAEAASPPPGLFDGTIKKSFVPQVLAQRWASVAGAGDTGKTILEALQGSILPEVVTATQQTLGVMTQRDVSRLAEEELVGIPAEVMSAMTLVTVDRSNEVKVVIYGPKENAERLASLIVGQPTPWEAGGNDAFGQLVEILGGRLRSCFDARGIKAEPHPVVSLAEADRTTTWAFRAGFQAASGERFVVGVSEPHGIE